MNRTNIDYGIDLGTTNSAISRIDGGDSKIIKSLDIQSDTTPSCVAFNKKGGVLVGDSAFRSYRSDCNRSFSRGNQVNSYVEFKRTMGTDETYFSSNVDKYFSSEELSAEILKRLKEHVSDENIDSAVITIPAAYNINQVDAVKRAASLAGFKYSETLQEPVAAAMAFGVSNQNKDGFWLVFDFGGGTFDAALIKVDEGIVKVVDTEGDNHLGGKDLDFAIVDNIVLPHIQNEFDVNNILSDVNKKSSFRKAYKFHAEQIKNNLSFQDKYELYIEPGDAGEDDYGEEIEIDLSLTKADLNDSLRPIFQKAIDLSIDLLKRNNLDGSQLASLILVGGPTLSPILREMLSDQICSPDTSVDPMTVVAKGAAIYASTIALPSEIIDEKRDRSKVQIEISCEASSVETEEFATIKILEDKTDNVLPDKIFAEIQRSDGAWSSEKLEIDIVGEVFDVSLIQGKTNVFNVSLFDNNGNRLDCEPSSFSLIQGSVLGSMTLTKHFGIEIMQKSSGDFIFMAAQGLEKNKSLPAKGIVNGLITQKVIRPGMKEDFIKIPLYQGEHYAEGTKAIHNDHVRDVVISSADLPKLLPAQSSVDLTIMLDKNQNINVEAYFPYLDFSVEIEVATDTVQSVNTDWLNLEFAKAEVMLNDLDHTSPEIADKAKTLSEAKANFEKSPDDVDTKLQSRAILREVLKGIDEIKKRDEWPNLVTSLKHEFERLEKANQDLGNVETTAIVESLRKDLHTVLSAKDVRLGRSLLDSIHSMFFQLTRVYQLMGIIQEFNAEFDYLQWSDRHKARVFIDEGLDLISRNANADQLQPVISGLFSLLPENEKSKIDDSVLVG